MKVKWNEVSNIFQNKSSSNIVFVLFLSKNFHDYKNSLKVEILLWNFYSLIFFLFHNFTYYGLCFIILVNPSLEIGGNRKNMNYCYFTFTVDVVGCNQINILRLRKMYKEGKKHLILFLKSYQSSNFKKK